MKGSRLLRVLGIAAVLAIVMAMVPATAALALTGAITLSAASGAPGTPISAACTGFTASTTWTAYFVSATYGTVAATPTITNSTGTTGNFTAQFTVPAVPRATYSVVVRTAAGDDSNSVSFLVVPGISLSVGSGYVGDPLTVTGSGFNASASVIVYYDGTAIVSTTSTTAGQVTVQTTVPQSSAGAHTVTAADSLGSVSATFTVLPKMTVSPTSGAVGDLMTISGTGYGASQTVTIYFDGLSIGTTASSTVGSVAQLQIAVPASARGNHTLTMTDALGYTYSVTFVTSQKMTMTPATGPGGTKVTLSGSGFAANAVLTITFDDVATNAPATTSTATGGFGPVTFDVPPSPGGAHTVKVSDGTNVDSKTFTVTTTATINPASGFVGSKITVNASGFLGNASISITFADTLLKTVTSGANGSFSTTVDVPAKAAGTYQVRVTDGTNTITTNFAITTTVSINPVTSAGSPGYVGQQVTVSGVGFIAGRTVTVSYEGQSVATGTVGTDNTFSLTFAAPASKGGSHAITVSDGLNSLPLTFVMESSAPPIPALLKPDSGARVKATPTFTWTPVSDPSQVTYTLQVASSQDFNTGSILLQKTGLAGSGQYTVTAAEKLQSVSSKTPYYWRVASIDGASNTAGYSTPRAFSVGFILELPMWAIIVLIVLGAVIIALLFFWLGRRAAVKRDIV